MREYFYESTSIGQDDGTTFFWHQLPSDVGPVMHVHGENVVVHDDRGGDWTGDEFWDMAGCLERWEVRR